MNENVVSACVLIIGNEILSGRTQDTNLSDLANQLNDWGVRVMEARVIPDVEHVIVRFAGDSGDGPAPAAPVGTSGVVLQDKMGANEPAAILPQPIMPNFILAIICLL